MQVGYWCPWKICNFPYHWAENNPFGGGLKIHYCVKVAECILLCFVIKFWNWSEEETSDHVLYKHATVVILRHTYLGSFASDRKDVRSQSLRAIQSFINGTGLPWLHDSDVSLRGTKALSKPTCTRTVKGSAPLFIIFHFTRSLEISKQGNPLILAICRIEWCFILCVYFQQ
jgi:hypothetical protein